MPSVCVNTYMIGLSFNEGEHRICFGKECIACHAIYIIEQMFGFVKVLLPIYISFADKF